MRILIIFACIAAGIAVLYKWRYRLLNTFLVFSLLRKIAPMITTNFSTIKEKILPKLFDQKEEAVEN